MEKLVIAEDTSNVDDVSSISSTEVREKGKKRRRARARKCLSSSSEDDIVREKILPALPQMSSTSHPTVNKNGELLINITQCSRENYSLIIFQMLIITITLLRLLLQLFQTNLLKMVSSICTHFFP